MQCFCVLIFETNKPNLGYEFLKTKMSLLKMNKSFRAQMFKAFLPLYSSIHLSLVSMRYEFIFSGCELDTVMYYDNMKATRNSWKCQ